MKTKMQVQIEQIAWYFQRDVARRRLASRLKFPA
jgi:hypothetical protein